MLVSIDTSLLRTWHEYILGMEAGCALGIEDGWADGWALGIADGWELGIEDILGIEMAGHLAWMIYLAWRMAAHLAKRMVAHLAKRMAAHWAKTMAHWMATSLVLRKETNWAMGLAHPHLGLWIRHSGRRHVGCSRGDQSLQTVDPDLWL